MPEASVLKINGTSYTIKDKFARKGKKNIIFIGDSYGNKPESDSTKNYVALITSWFADQIGVYYRNTVSGSAFNQCSTDPQYISFLQCLQNINSTVTDKNAITDIVVCGGMNDCASVHGSTTYDDILTKIGEFVSYCHTTYPNARVSIGFIAYSSDINLSKELRQVYQMYKRCVEYGATYLSGVENALYTTHFSADVYHPGEEGEKAIALSVGNAIFSGYGNICDGANYKFLTLTNTSSTVAYTIGNTTWNVSNLAIAVSRNNNLLQFRIAYKMYYDFIKLTANTSISGWSKTSFDIAQVTAGPIFNDDGYSNIFTCCYLKNGTSTVGLTTAELNLHGKTLTLKLHGNGNNITFNGVELFPTCVVFDTRQIF